MKDFTFCVPTRFRMGRGLAAEAGAEIARCCAAERVLLVHDGGAYLSELLQTVRASILATGATVLELPEPALSPKLSLVQRGAALCRAQHIGFVLAVGGGTVMDTAKGIAFLAENEGELGEYVLYRSASPRCLPLGCIVTLSGTGSEVSATAMIVDDRGETPVKYPLFQESLRFRFALLDPSLTCTLPLAQTMAGAFDAFTHIFEHYFCGESGYELQDRLCEGLLRAQLENMRAVKSAPQSYELRAQLMMGATLANSMLPGLGCDSDWALHYLENPVTTLTHSPHGATLAILAPAWLRYCFGRDLKKAVQFALRVMEVPRGVDDEATALAGVAALAALLHELGLPARLSELGIEPAQFPELARRAALTAGGGPIGGVSRLTTAQAVEIYRLAQ